MILRLKVLELLLRPYIKNKYMTSSINIKIISFLITVLSLISFHSNAASATEVHCAGNLNLAQNNLSDPVRCFIESNNHDIDYAATYSSNIVANPGSPSYGTNCALSMGSGLANLSPIAMAAGIETFSPALNPNWGASDRSVVGWRYFLTGTGATVNDMYSCTNATNDEYDGFSTDSFDVTITNSSSEFTSCSSTGGQSCSEYDAIIAQRGVSQTITFTFNTDTINGTLDLIDYDDNLSCPAQTSTNASGVGSVGCTFNDPDADYGLRSFTIAQKEQGESPVNYVSSTFWVRLVDDGSLSCHMPTMGTPDPYNNSNPIDLSGTSTDLQCSALYSNLASTDLSLGVACTHAGINSGTSSATTTGSGYWAPAPITVSNTALQAREGTCWVYVEDSGGTLIDTYSFPFTNAPDAAITNSGSAQSTSDDPPWLGFNDSVNITATLTNWEASTAVTANPNGACTGSGSGISIPTSQTICTSDANGDCSGNIQVTASSASPGVTFTCPVVISDGSNTYNGTITVQTLDTASSSCSAGSSDCSMGDPAQITSTRNFTWTISNCAPGETVTPSDANTSAGYSWGFSADTCSAEGEASPTGTLTINSTTVSGVLGSSDISFTGSEAFSYGPITYYFERPDLTYSLCSDAGCTSPLSNPTNLFITDTETVYVEVNNGWPTGAISLVSNDSCAATAHINWAPQMGALPSNFDGNGSYTIAVDVSSTASAPTETSTSCTMTIENDANGDTKSFSQNFYVLDPSVSCYAASDAAKSSALSIANPGLCTIGEDCDFICDGLNLPPSHVFNTDNSSADSGATTSINLPFTVNGSGATADIDFTVSIPPGLTPGASVYTLFSAQNGISTNTAFNIGVTNCGNNTIDAGEQCDDDNLVNGDGCSNSCQLEGPVMTCADVSVAAYVGNTVTSLCDFSNLDPGSSLQGEFSISTPDGGSYNSSTLVNGATITANGSGIINDIPVIFPIRVEGAGNYVISVDGFGSNDPNNASTMTDTITATGLPSGIPSSPGGGSNSSPPPTNDDDINSTDPDDNNDTDDDTSEEVITGIINPIRFVGQSCINPETGEAYINGLDLLNGGNCIFEETPISVNNPSGGPSYTFEGSWTGTDPDIDLSSNSLLGELSCTSGNSTQSITSTDALDTSGRGTLTWSFNHFPVSETGESTYNCSGFVSVPGQNVNSFPLNFFLTVRENQNIEDEFLFQSCTGIIKNEDGSTTSAQFNDGLTTTTIDLGSNIANFNCSITASNTEIRGEFDVLSSCRCIEDSSELSSSDIENLFSMPAVNLDSCGAPMLENSGSNINSNRFSWDFANADFSYISSLNTNSGIAGAEFICSSNINQVLDSDNNSAPVPAPNINIVTDGTKKFARFKFSENSNHTGIIDTNIQAAGATTTPLVVLERDSLNLNINHILTAEDGSSKAGNLKDSEAIYRIYDSANIFNFSGPGLTQICGKPETLFGYSAINAPDEICGAQWTVSASSNKKGNSSIKPSQISITATASNVSDNEESIESLIQVVNASNTGDLRPIIDDTPLSSSEDSLISIVENRDVRHGNFIIRINPSDDFAGAIITDNISDNIHRAASKSRSKGSVSDLGSLANDAQLEAWRIRLNLKIAEMISLRDKAKQTANNTEALDASIELNKIQALLNQININLQSASSKVNNFNSALANANASTEELRATLSDIETQIRAILQNSGLQRDEHKDAREELSMTVNKVLNDKNLGLDEANKASGINGSFYKIWECADLTVTLLELIESALETEN